MIKEAWIFSSDIKGIPFKELNFPADNDLFTYSEETSGSNKFDQSYKLRQRESIIENQDPADIPTLLNLLKDPDQSVRLAAMDTLSNFGPLMPLDQIVKIAFDHADPQMRLAVLGMGLEIPYNIVVDHALHDPSPQVRIESLQILGGSENIEEVARHAINDSDPSVQDIAREILKGISEENTDILTEEDVSFQLH